MNTRSVNALFLALAAAWLLLAPGFVRAEQPPERASVWEEANLEYRDKHYAASASLYRSLLAGGREDPALYFNLGNACYRTGELGYALYYYEKAFSLDPRSRDIRRNRDLTRRRLKVAEGESYTPFAERMNRLLSWLRLEETLIFLLAIYLLFLALSLLRYLRPGKQTVRLRRLSFFVLLAALIVFGGKWYFSRPPKAIVLTPQAEARYGPSAQEKLAFTLAEGVKVKVVDRSDGWRRIVFLKEKTGWVKDADLGLI